MKRFLSIFMSIALLLTFVPATTFAETEEPTEKESNDDFASATPITVTKDNGQTYYNFVGTFKSETDHDFYKVTLNKRGANVLILIPNATGQYNVKVYNSNKQLIEFVTSKQSANEDDFGTQIIGMERATYYVEIYPESGQLVNQQYVAGISQNAYDYVEIENNDSIQTATPLTLGEETIGAFGGVDNFDDVFAIDVPEDGLLYLDGWRYPLSYSVVLLDEHGEYITEWWSKVDKSDSEALVEIGKIGLKKGRYYVVLTFDEEDEDLYGLTYKFRANVLERNNIELETNNTKQDATVMTAGEWRGQVASKSDVDFYKFVAAKAQVGEFILSATSPVQVAVYDVNGVLVKQTVVKQLTKLALQLKKGTYYIKVMTSSKDYDIDYKLKWNVKK